MRFNNRACALMEIPDLPQGAFEHCGDGKIKPQGGGGGDIISAVTDPISDVLGTSGGGGGILGAVEDVGQAVGGGLEDIAQGASNVLAEADKSVGYKLPHIAAVLAVPYLAPELAALAAPEAAFVGATETGLATLAGEGALADTVGATLLAGGTDATTAALTDALATATAEAATALPYSEAYDAVNQATRLSLSEGDIARNLTMTGMQENVATDMARLATQGLSPDQIVQTLSYSYTPAELVGTNIESKALGLPSKGLTAGQALQGIRLASGLLGQRPQMPQMQQQQLQMPQVRPAGAVDYTGLLNLLSPRMAQRNPYSLLG
jgi:hypothetical protein